MHERLAVAARLFDPPLLCLLGFQLFLFWVIHLLSVLNTIYDPILILGSIVITNLRGTASVHLHGFGGRTVAKLWLFNLHVVEQIAPDVLILEIGTNDLVDTSPEVLGSKIESLVCLLLESYLVCIICVCHVIPRGLSHNDAASFAECVEIRQQYLDVVLSPIPDVFCWLHVNPTGKYHLNHCYRGAILRALGMLQEFLCTFFAFFEFFTSSTPQFFYMVSNSILVQSWDYILWG